MPSKVNHLIFDCTQQSMEFERQLKDGLDDPNLLDIQAISEFVLDCLLDSPSDVSKINEVASYLCEELSNQNDHRRIYRAVSDFAAAAKKETERFCRHPGDIQGFKFKEMKHGAYFALSDETGTGDQIYTSAGLQ